MNIVHRETQKITKFKRPKRSSSSSSTVKNKRSIILPQNKDKEEAPELKEMQENKCHKVKVVIL